MNAGDAGWQRFSYQWNDAFTEATLVPGATSARKFFGFTDGGADAGHWQVYPSRRECLRCHNPTAGTVLGPQAAQLQRNVDYGALATNQFGVWLQGVFEPAEFPPVNPLSSPGDVSEPLGKRARSSLAANCAHCHQPGAEGSTRDYRWETPTRDGGLCDDVLPGDAGYSRLHLRMAARDGGQMPPIATERVDTSALSIVDEWINSMATCQ